LIRLIVALLYAVFGIIFSLPFHYRMVKLAKKDQKLAWEKSRKYVNGFFSALIFIAGTKVEVRGAENLPDSPALFVGNHRSYFDIIITQTLMKQPLGFVAKKEFETFPLLPLFMKDIGCLFLDRNNIREGLKTINEGIECMKNGLSLALYPEGTRNHTDELLPFKTGGYRIAEKSDSPIIVMAATNFGKIFEENKFHMICRRHVIIEFAKPVYPSQLSKEERAAFYNGIPGQINAMLESHKN